MCVCVHVCVHVSVSERSFVLACVRTRVFVCVFVRACLCESVRLSELARKWLSCGALESATARVTRARAIVRVRMFQCVCARTRVGNSKRKCVRV